MDKITDEEVIDAMEAMGGGFASALAVAWRKADMGNRETLRQAFPYLYDLYKRHAEAHKARPQQ